MINQDNAKCKICTACCRVGDVKEPKILDLVRFLAKPGFWFGSVRTSCWIRVLSHLYVCRRGITLQRASRRARHASTPGRTYASSCCAPSVIASDSQRALMRCCRATRYRPATKASMTSSKPPHHNRPRRRVQHTVLCRCGANDTRSRLLRDVPYRAAKWRTSRWLLADML